MILIHFRIPVFGDLLAAYGRFAVPIFFLCSGYFCGAEFNAKRVWKKTASIGKILLFSVILYMLRKLLGKNPAKVFLEGFQLTRLRDWILVNRPIFTSDHLWFLYSLIYIYVFWIIINRLRLVKPAGYFVLIFSALLILYQETRTLIPFVTIPYFAVRPVYGMLLFLIGNRLRVLQPKVQRLSNKAVLFLLLLGIGLVFAEYCITNRYGQGSVYTELSFGSAITACSLFILAVNHPGREGILSRIGKNDSLLIYVLHPLLLELIGRVGLDRGVMAWFVPILVYLLCVFISVAYRKLKARLFTGGGLASL